MYPSIKITVLVQHMTGRGVTYFMDLGQENQDADETNLVVFANYRKHYNPCRTYKQ